MLPDILDPVGVPSGECSPKGFDTTLDCFGMTLERGFTPAYDTVRGFDTNEYPSGRNTESLVISIMRVYLNCWFRWGHTSMVLILMSGRKGEKWGIL